MEYQVTKIILHTENLGDFKFENHFNSNADFYQAMCNFESNNWEKLGVCSYTTTCLWNDETETENTWKGMNAGYHLSHEMENSATDLKERIEFNKINS